MWMLPRCTIGATRLECFMSNKNILLIAIGGVFILLIYAVDLFKLNYRLADWQKFGETPVMVDHIEYFIADTPNLLGYTDHALGREVSCFEAVAFVKTDAQEKYRCCDAGEEISCIKGDFSSDIPPSDEQCVTELMDIFGVPDTLAGSKEYQLYGSCSGGRFAELTIVQLDTNGNIQWKFVEVGPLQTINSVLRCVIGPILLLIVFWAVYGIFRGKPNERVRKF